MRDAVDLSGLFGSNDRDHQDDVDARHLGEDTFVYSRGAYPVKFLMVVTGAYNDQVRRSFTANVDDNNRNDLTDLLIGTSAHADFIGTARLANDIIKPDTRIDKQLNIVNGWDEPRIRFYLELRRNLGNGSFITYAYTGFTDHVGVTLSGNIDQELKLHVTSCTVINRNDTVGSRIHSDKSYYVNEIHYAGEYRQGDIYRNTKEYLMDPSAAIYMHAASSTHFGNDLDGSPIVPGHASIGLSSKIIDRSYNIPSHYLSKLINTKRQVIEDDHLYSSADPGDEYAGMLQRRRTLLGGSASRGDMTDPLAGIYREMGFNDSATLTYGDLVEYLPDIDSSEVTTIIFPEEVSRSANSYNLGSVIRSAGQYGLDADNWDGANVETIIATSICQQLPNLMMSELIGSVRFTVTNEVASRHQSFDDSHYHWIYGDSRGDTRNALWFLLDLPYDLQRTKQRNFEIKVEGIILDSVTHNGLIDINLTVDCDVKSECIVYISVNGGQEYKFIMPCFADAMASPLVTSDINHYTGFVNDIINLVDDSYDQARLGRRR